MANALRRLTVGVAWVVGCFSAWFALCCLFVTITEYLERQGTRMPHEVGMCYNVVAMIGFAAVPGVVAVMALRGKLPGTRPPDSDDQMEDAAPPLNSVTMTEHFPRAKIKNQDPRQSSEDIMSSSAFPDFESHEPYPFQVLPDGVHSVDESTFRARFVADFPGSQVRSTIGDGFFLLRREALSQGLIATQWVDGSFVESKLEPGDIDLVSFMDYDILDALAPTIQTFVEQTMNGGEATKTRYQTHTFLVPSCLPSHPFFPVFEQLRAYWRDWFGQTREEPIRPGPKLRSIPKGIVELLLGDPKLAPRIPTERWTK